MAVMVEDPDLLVVLGAVSFGGKPIKSVLIFIFLDSAWYC